MHIVYDEIKRRSNQAKHGLDFADLTMSFFDEARTFETTQDRLMAIGEFEGSGDYRRDLPAAGAGRSLGDFYASRSRKERKRQ